ncbi:MAG: DUF4399 domain-containing protein [Actinomycetota bacterium]
MHRFLRLMLAMALVVLVGCSSDTNETDGESTGASTGVEASEPDFSVAFESPSDGDTVNSPVLLQMSASGVELEPAGEAREDAGHLHVIVDTDCVEPGQVIPSDDSHVHFGAEPLTERTIELEPGERTLCLQLGDGEHIATGATDTITVTVR